LNPVGEFSAQLASLIPAGGYARDDNGDILRLKFVTHGNSLRFTINVDVLGGLLDPISVFSGGPAFSVYFDTVINIDLQLPHKSTDGIRLISARMRNAGVSIHPENGDADFIAGQVAGPIQNSMNAAQTDLSGQFGPKIQSLSPLLAQNEFDQAVYSNSGPTLLMKAIQHPYRNFEITIDYVENLSQGRVEPHVATEIGLPGIPKELTLNPFPEFHGIQPVSKHFADGTRYLIIEIQISRQFIHTVVGGVIVKLGDHTYIRYDDGTMTDLGVGFNASDPASAELLKGLLPKRNPSPPGKAGLVRVLYLHVDYGLTSIIGRYNGISLFKALTGQQIRVPGDNVTIPTIWFTVSMTGTRNTQIPNIEPQIPARPGLSAVYVGTH
jgi:hypothetical protein